MAYGGGIMERAWATNLSEEEYVREFMRRMPFADAIPTRENYIGMPETKDKGITGVKPEDYVIDENFSDETAPLEKDDLKDDHKKQYACRGCGRVFDLPIARAGHERKCKAKLIMKEVNENG